METHLPTKSRRGWRTTAIILSPLILGLLWCAFIEQESIAGFVLGVFGSILSGAVVLAVFLLKKSARRPFASALLILGYTIIGIVAVFIAASLAIMAIYGDSDEAYSGLGFIFMLVAPVAVLLGIVAAAKKFLKERRGAIHGVGGGAGASSP